MDVEEKQRTLIGNSWWTNVYIWVISFRANYSNQLTCIPFAVTNKALPVKELAEDPINKLIFPQF